ncbi:RibD family protein [Mucilaginibacter robiniae]|uniref:RibD family protein n=1 Tax=Mucilaginibacter robiniae TaxID=2728022 RepID=A0A7L5E6A3_9SPHI|nr:RibD family protein [Mucilaginibacter robiniae]QJD97907.1 RibD family protein [Mucilaginibacter robiniae]
MKKPHVICHMMSTVDGKILSANWGDQELIKTYSGFFEKYHETFESEAWMCGRITMEKDFSGGEKLELTQTEHPIARQPFIGNKEATSFAIAVDAHGKLGWKSNETGGDHIIEVLSEQVSDEYLNYLQQKGISYIFAGEKEVDFKSALSQLADLFPINTLMLEGGGHLNGSLLNDGLIDELSILILPIADGTPKSATTFEVSEYLQKRPASLLQLTEVKQLENDVIWLKYKFNNQ